MGIENRPYVGSWRLGREQLVQYTPDALVYLNGDISIPGCPKCNGKINIQQFLTEVTVDAGVDPGAASASFTLSVPVHYNEAFARDAKFILHPGLEVQVYTRGYFPVKGLYSNTGDPDSNSFTDETGLDSSPQNRLGDGLLGNNIEDVLSYPYYHTFRGVVVQVANSYSSGVQSITVQCQSLLHFWSYQPVSTNAGLFGARPLNSRLKTSLVGHNFTGMHPYEIMYTLHRDWSGAAGGVAFVMGSETNQQARSSVLDGTSLYDLYTEYWRQRFRSNEVKLRLHGATGALFNTAQAVFLGNTSSRSLTKLLRGRFGHTKGAEPEVLRRAQVVGLANPDVLESLKFVRAARPQGSTDDPQMDINLVEMQAFVTNIPQLGQVNLFESSYESKMNIAQKVAQVTGFEFYQDVDGDLVFKPPFYNLDTSESRVYRIEDIDLISINFNESEPAATYVTIQGGAIKNMQGHGLENEWGVRGQFIDYRLVAKYGWRGEDLETNYLADRKSMFFAAINRLDVLNAPMNKATITIPIRPEIRPGYPVYIPYLDAFYYIQGLSHSFNVGGSCTTNLDLVGKRAKFYAPGDPTRDGVEAIDLGNLTAPQKPLKIVDGLGQPRLSGFPNVVMALDPSQVNPLFFMVGSGLDLIDNPYTLQGILRIATSEEFKILGFPEGGQDGPLYTMTIGDNLRKELYFDFGYSGNAENEAIPTGAVNLRRAAIKFAEKQQEINESLETRQEKIKEIRDKIAQLQIERRDQSQDMNDPLKAQRVEEIDRELGGYQGGTIPNSALRGLNRTSAAGKRRIALLTTGLEGELGKMIAEYESSRASFMDYLDQETQIGIGFLIRIVEQIGEAYARSIGHDAYKDFTSTVNLLDLLSESKAIMTNGKLPGSYRYYSASHPIPDNQGQQKLHFKQNVEGGSTVSLTDAPLENGGAPIDGYLASSRIVAREGGIKPEAELTSNHRPQRGIAVLTGTSTEPVKVLATNEIKELTFAVHNADLRRRASSTRRRNQVISVKNSLLTVWRKEVKLLAKRAYLSGDNTLSINGAFQSWYVDISSKVDAAARLAREMAKEGDADFGPFAVPLPDFPDIAEPESISIRGKLLPVTTIPGDLNLKDQGGDITYPSSPSDSTEVFWKRAAQDYGSKVFQSFLTAKKSWEAIWQTQFEGRVNSLFNSALISKFNLTALSPEREKQQVTALNTKSIQSPIFPVSDAKGYEVIGSYRYGRGISIEPNGVYDVIRAQDPLSFVNREDVEAALTQIVQENGIASDLEARIIKQLQQNMTDSQILDYGMAVQKDGEPLSLDLGLANFFATKNKEGVMKVPLANAAYSLADISLPGSKHVCQCKAAEADVLLSNVGVANFVQLALPEGVDVESLDNITKWQISASTFSGIDWEQSQRALRGEGVDRAGGAPTINAGRNLFTGEAFENTLKQTEQITEEVVATAEGVPSLFTDLADGLIDFNPLNIEGGDE